MRGWCCPEPIARTPEERRNRRWQIPCANARPRPLTEGEGARLRHHDRVGDRRPLPALLAVPDVVQAAHPVHGRHLLHPVRRLPAHARQLEVHPDRRRQRHVPAVRQHHRRRLHERFDRARPRLARGLRAGAVPVPPARRRHRPGPRLHRPGHGRGGTRHAAHRGRRVGDRRARAPGPGRRQAPQSIAPLATATSASG